MKLYIGENLKRLRLERGLTQEALAAKLGVSFQSVSRWETDQSYPDVETIPEIAAFFGVSTDELMGVDRAVMEKRLHRDWDKVNQMNTAEEQIEHLRMMHRLYPKEKSVLYMLILVLSNKVEYLNEQRQLTEEFMKTHQGESFFRDKVAEELIASELEENLPKLLDCYTTCFDMTREAVLEYRYMKRGEYEKAEKYRQLTLLMRIDRVMESFTLLMSNEKPTSDVYRRSLEICNLFSGTMGKSITVGDGVPDLWFSRRFIRGYRLAEACVIEGNTEEALVHIENLTNLYERFYSTPAGTSLTFRCPELSDLEVTFEESKCRPNFFNVSNEDERYWCLKSTQKDYGIDLMYHEDPSLMRADQYFIYCPQHSIYPLVAKYGWEGFDPIRDNPRFIACVERMNKFIIEV